MESGQVALDELLVKVTLQKDQVGGKIEDEMIHCRLDRLDPQYEIFP
jgi:hypothetical protein